VGLGAAAGAGQQPRASRSLASHAWSQDWAGAEPDQNIPSAVATHAPVSAERGYRVPLEP
jgi:hypothetical protein